MRKKEISDELRSNVLVSELTATTNRVKIIADNVSDEVTKTLASQSLAMLSSLTQQIISILQNGNNPPVDESKGK